MKSFAWRIFLMTAALGLVVIVFLLMQPRPVKVDVAVVMRDRLAVTVRDDGQTRIRERYVVSAPLSGRLVRTTLDPGDEVAAGETILTSIEPTEASLLDPRAVALARARVGAAEARLKRCQPQLEAAQVALNHAESEMGRLQRLADKNAGSQQQLDAQIVAYRKAGHDFETARFEMEIAKFELEVANAALTQAGGQHSTPETTEDGDAPPIADRWGFPIRSPISGRVLRVFQESSTVVQAGEPILEVGDAHDLEVVVDLLSTEAVRISPGDRVVIDQWGGDEPLSGQVRLIEPSAFTKVSALGIEEQRVNVLIDFDGASDCLPNLGDGYRVETEIVEWESDDVLQVPAGALFREADSWAVYAVRGNRAALTPITLGHRNDDAAEVLEGLNQEDRVILYPGNRVQDGIAVEPAVAE